MLTLLSLSLVSIACQLIYMQCQLFLKFLLTTHRMEEIIPDSKARKVIAHQGPSYLLSTLHALYVTSRGVQHLVRLSSAPVVRKLVHPWQHETVNAAEAFYITESARVLWSNLVLCAYLLIDLIHVLAQYPTLGGIDTVCHHVAFLLCGLVAGNFMMNPFMFGWLIVGEASTPLLNARWFLIKANMGSTTAFKIIEKLFAFVFILTRVFVYTAGLIYHIPMLKYVPSHVPKWAIFVTSSLVIAGFILNLTWSRKIYKLATGQSKRVSEHASEQKSGNDKDRRLRSEESVSTTVSTMDTKSETLLKKTE